MFLVIETEDLKNLRNALYWRIGSLYEVVLELRNKGNLNTYEAMKLKNLEAECESLTRILREMAIMKKF